jgi:hypothetical protein
MTVLSQNVEDMLKRLETHSKSELNLIRALSDAIRQVDEAALRELRDLTLTHELRRESILGELQMIAGRLCQLPAKPSSAIKAAVDQPPLAHHKAQANTLGPLANTGHNVVRQAAPLHHDPRHGAALHGDVLPAGMMQAAAPTPHCDSRSAGDWRQAARNIEDDLDFAFGPPPMPRH